MRKIQIIVLLLTVFQISIFAQYSVKVGEENSGTSCFEPCNNQYDYGWSATVYTRNDIQSHGLITDIYYKSSLFGGFGPGANTFMNNQRIFMKLVTDNEMTSNAFPDTTQMTLVFSGMVEFLNYQLATIHLNIPFNLDENHNLMILYINKHGNAETNQNYFLLYPAQHNYTPNNTVYNNGNGSLPSGAGTFSNDMPVVYLRYDSGLDAGISSINNNELFKLPQQADLTCKIHNYMADTLTSADIEWELNGTPQTTYNWAGNSYCGQDVALILQQNFAFAPGNYNIKTNTANPNSGTDELNTNDTLNVNITVSDYRQFTSANYQDNTIPFLSNRPYGWSVSIYNKDSIGIQGPINAIAYYVSNTNGMEEPHQKIFMRTTADLTNSSLNYPDTNLFTKVFDGTIDYTSIGWHIIKFDTVFDYNNSENLMILYENHAGIESIQATNFKTVWLHTNAIYNYDMNSFPTSAGQTASNSRVPAIQIYFSIPKDAGVIKLANSNVPVFTGNNDFIIDFKNFGTDTLQDVDINYQIDQNTPASYHWNGVANPQNEITNLNIGSSNLNYGNHDITIWTENPDFLPDYVNRNDTLKISLRACSPLSGNYTIGSAPSDFLTVKAAIDSLNNCGINGAVTFNIKPGTYNSQYVLNEVLGTSATNTITFQSATGDSTDVVLTTDSTDYLFKLYGADYITFKHLTFMSDSATNIIVLDSTCTNNIFIGNVFTSDASNCTFLSSIAGFNQNNISIENNLFENGKTGIEINQDDNNFIANLIIQNNVFNSQSQKSIALYKINKSDILNNDFNVINKGIYSNNCDNINVNANNLRLNSANKGIYVDKCLSVIISNNFISGKTSGTYNSPIYINNYNTYENNVAKIFYNSINMTEAECALYINSVDSVYSNNNILINRAAQIIKKYSTVYVGNYNCFYTNNNIFASNESPDNITDISSWQTATNQDSNSVFALPYFYNDSNLHTNSIVVDNVGTPLTLITDDLDGEPRNATTPDIGADEFTTTCSGPLSGTYTIGTTGDYVTINNAVTSLYDCGVADTVVFNVETGNYNEQVNINGSFITYDSIPYPITFQSGTGDSSDVILQYNADSLNNYVLKLSGTKNMYFKNMTFKSLDTNYARLLVLDDSVDNIVFSNNQFIGSQSISDDNQIACIYADNLNETDTMAITFNNNYITNGSYGIDFGFGGSVQVKTNFISSYNKFYNQSYAGIYLSGVKYLQHITHNIIQSTNNPVYGILIEFSDTTNISFNQIHIASSRLCYGIENNSLHNIIANNFISIQAKTNIDIIGYNSSGPTRFYNNSILCFGQDGSSSCVVYSSSDPGDFQNNNLISLTGNVLNINSSSYHSDYNNLYSVTNHISSSTTSLIDWQNSSGQDAHSVSFLPNFVSNTDLHTHDALLNGKATPLTEVTTDIDGELRNATNPDIGADEFDNPVFNAGNDTVFCYYSDQYNNTSSHVYDIGFGYDTYLWSNGSDSSSIVINTSNTPIGNSNYTITVTIGSDTYSDTVNILYDKPNPITQLDYCYWNTPITITANPGFESYSWSSGDTTQLISYNSSGAILDILVQDSLGCYAKKTLNSIVGAYMYSPYSNYPANFGISDTSICNNQSLLLSANQYSDSNVYGNFSFEWNTGDTTQSLTIDSNSFAPGNYMLTTTVYLEANQLCTSSDTINITITDCSGIPEIDNFDITVYPIPAHDQIIVDGEKIDNYQILSVTGIMLRQQSIKTMPVTIDVSNLSKGIYFLKLQFDNHLSIKKIIIH